MKKLTEDQLKTLKKTGKVKVTNGTITRIEQAITRYYDVGAKKFKTKNKVYRQYKMSLDKDFLTYLKVMDAQ